MNEVDNKNQSETEKTDSRSGVIKDVQTPLGFFVLIVLIVEVILGITANTSSGPDKTYLIVGMLGLIFLLILIVAGMAIFRPASLYGKGVRNRSRSASSKQLTNNLLIVQNPKEHQVSVLASLKNAKHSFYETAINQPRTPPTNSFDLENYFSTGQTEYKRVLYKRLTKREIRYANVRVIPYKQGLEFVIFLALLHEGQPYFLRYYDFLTTKIPMFDIVSTDNTEFFVGGFYSIDDSVEAKVLYSQETDLNMFFKDYWQILWQNSIPIIDDREAIRWDELKQLGIQFGIQEQEFEELVSKLKIVVQKVKKQAKFA